MASAPKTHGSARSGHTSIPRSTPSPTPSLNAQARSTFQSSFAKFEQTVTKLSRDDHRDFASTVLEDVRKAAREVEQQLAARQCLRNMRRIEPLLNGLESFSKVIEVLCNGTPYLSWIWAPIKLMLQLAADHTHAFEKLIAAYGRIAEALPRFDRLSSAIHDPDFQKVLAVIYSDILEFHRRAYKFFRKSGWLCFFNSSWGRFEARFSCILESLSRHADLIDREANAFLIAETMQWRQEALKDAAKKDKERLVAQLNSVLAWLRIDSAPYCSQEYQEDALDRLSDDCYAGTTEWILQNHKVRTWLKPGYAQPILWIKGKPGSGKSTLCAKLIQFLRKDGHSTVLFCFYTYHLSGLHTHPSTFIFATMLSQILRQYQNLSTYVYIEFVANGLSPSLQNLKEAFRTIIPQVKAPRILMDGVDECVRYDEHGNPRDLNAVKEVLRDVLQLAAPVSTSLSPKVLLVSRDILQISGFLTKKPTLSLDHEADAVRKAIRTFTHQRLQEIQHNFQGFQAVDTILHRLEDEIVQKSRGMFLWVRLILGQLEDDVYSLHDLETAVADMPVGLNDFYARIVARLGLLNPKSEERATRILQWIICAKRPLRLAELQGAIVHDHAHKHVTEKTRLPDTVISLCKPLVQVLGDGTIAFVHFTVQEYLLTSSSVKHHHAERTVAVACLAYLESSTKLVEHSVAEDEATIQVCKGFHALQPYAYEHWVDHLLDYISPHNTLGSQDEDFITHVYEFCATIRRYQEQLRDSHASTHQGPALTDFHEPRLANFGHHPSIVELLTKVVHHRAVSRSCFGDTGADPQAPSVDPTPFSEVNSKYNKQVHFLLATRSLSGVTTSELDEFKYVYGPFAYHCRFPGCSDASTSFSTDDLRLRHENTHVPSLICTFSTCTYSLAFQSISGLKRHIRENHANETPRIPGSINMHSKHFPGQASFRNGSASQRDIVSSSRTDFDVRPTNIVGSSSSDVTTDNSFTGILQPKDDAEQPSWASTRRYRCFRCAEYDDRIIQDLILHESRDHIPLLSNQTVTCPFCSVSRLFIIQEYERHLQYQHGGDPDANIYRDHITYAYFRRPCMWCGDHPDHKVENVFSHEWDCHKFYESYVTPRECPFCSKQVAIVVRSSVDFQHHLQSSHAEEPVALLNLEHMLKLEARTWKQRLGRTSQPISTDQRTYRCNWCLERSNAYYPTLISLMEHESSDHSFQQPYLLFRGNCMVCSWKQTETLVHNPIEYLKHLEASHDQTAHASSYIDHLRALYTEIGEVGVGNRDANDLTYFCNWCVSRAADQFDTLQDLIAHERTHKDTVIIKGLCFGICNFCTKRLGFVTGAKLVEHVSSRHTTTPKGVTHKRRKVYLPHLRSLLE